MDASSSELRPGVVARALGVFAHRAFATIWFANLAALIGVAMYDTASGWRILQLGHDPGSVAMLRAAINMPIFLVTLLAGALADVFDPRRLLIASSVAAAALTTVFAILVALQFDDVRLLLATTFLLSAALSLAAPAWFAIAPRLVEPRQLPGVMAANAVAYNLSRALGPALGGLAISRYGMVPPCLFMIAGNLALWWALDQWRPPPTPSTGLPAERLTSAIKTGLRHALNNRPFLVAQGRALAIYPFAAAYWGLLPLIASRIDDHASFYGVLLSAISVGTILGAYAQRFLRAWIGDDELVALGSALSGAALIGFAFAEQRSTVIEASLVAGAGGVMVLASLYAATERTLAAWVRARGLSIFMTVVFGALGFGSLLWGWVAHIEGLHLTFVIAGVGAFLAIPLTFNLRLDAAASLDLSPSGHWAVPRATREIDNGRGPVLVRIEYQIDTARRTEFLRAMDELGYERRRDGAFGWGIFEDATANGRFEEAYLIESWLELLHLRERVTKADLMLEEEIREVLTAPPKIEYLVFAEARRSLFGAQAAKAGA